MARQTNRPSGSSATSSNATTTGTPPSGGLSPLPDWLTSLLGFGKGFGWFFLVLGVIGLIVVMIVSSCGGPTTKSAQQMPAAVYCRPAPESFRNGSRELRFRNSSPLCYDVVLGDEWTPLIYPPLENKSGDDLINLITPGEVEVRVLNSQSYKWTETEESLTRRSKLAWNFNEKCMIFRLRGSGTVRIQVDRRERMTPGGVEQSTHCPGMY